MNTKEHYNLECHCTNCALNFFAEIPFGEDANESLYGSGIYYGKESVTCPKCGSYKVTKRL